MRRKPHADARAEDRCTADEEECVGAADHGQKDAAGARPILRSLDAVDRALLRATTAEVSKLEYRVGFLATTASISPYIGLFGTVWGIMVAFVGIAESQTTSLAVVAPGIAGALLATAAGLAAAIPAVLIYNFSAKQISKQAGKLDDFASEFIALVSRDMDRRAG